MIKRVLFLTVGILSLMLAACETKAINNGKKENKMKTIELTKYNPHFQISIESQTKRLNFEPFGKTKCSKIDKHTAQKNVEKTRFFETVC